MSEHQASRTLVKSPPELWMQCSDAGSLARHLDHFGEIRITRLEPETTVAWEGESASGTVHLEPSGWGTKVILTASPTGTEATPAPSDPPSAPAGPAARRRLFDWMGRLLSSAPPPPPAVPLPAGDSRSGSSAEHEAALATALESLGAAHHRPFSRP